MFVSTDSRYAFPCESSRIELRNNNSGANAIAKNALINQHNKHIEVKYYSVCDCNFVYLFRMSKFPLAELAAKIFTKPLLRTKVEYLHSKFGRFSIS